jgi:hypothetical protein
LRVFGHLFKTNFKTTSDHFNNAQIGVDHYTGL